MDLTIGLLRDVGKLYDEADDYNVCITVGGEEEGVEIETFKAHSVILRSRSMYFKTALSDNDEVKKDGEFFILKKPSIHPNIFRLLLKYIYTGICKLDEKDMKDMYIPLLLAASELSLLDLVKYIQLHIITNEQSWLHENINSVFYVATHSTAFLLLSNHCYELICEIPSLIFNTPSFTRLEKSSLLKIIKRDDLCLDEIAIWKYLLQWAINQYPSLNSCSDVSDTSSWTKEDFIELEDRLKDFLPYIRFFQIPGNQLYEFVWPFRRILPKQLKSQLTKFYMIPNSELPSSGGVFNLTLRVPKYNIESLHISARHAGMLKSWITKSFKGEMRRRDEINFKLLLRGSRDGMDVNTFHKLCDNKGPTIVLIKVLESNNIVNDNNGSDSIFEKLMDNKCDNLRENKSDSQRSDITDIVSRKSESFRSKRSNSLISNLSVSSVNVNNNVNHVSTSNVNITNNDNSNNSIVIGGYNPLNWSSSDSYLQTGDSFIFSFTNPLTRRESDTDKYILSKVSNSQYAIRDMSCKFNNIGFGHDLWWFSGSCTQQYYEKRILPKHVETFIMEDYEVFQVTCSNEKSKDTDDENLEKSESVGEGEVKGEAKGEAKDEAESDTNEQNDLNVDSDDKGDVDSLSDVVVQSARLLTSFLSKKSGIRYR